MAPGDLEFSGGQTQHQLVGVEGNKAGSSSLSGSSEGLSCHDLDGQHDSKGACEQMGNTFQVSHERDLLAVQVGGGPPGINKGRTPGRDDQIDCRLAEPSMCQ